MGRCIWCDKDIDEGKSIIDLLIYSEDQLCLNCRNKFRVINKKLKIENIEALALYEYDDNFKDYIVQYKDCMDEALKDIFLYPYIQKIKRKYKGYTIVPMPSSDQKYQERGFNHLIGIFEKTGLNICDCLYKDNNDKQVTSNYEKRKQMSKHIKLKNDVCLDKVLFVDDVLTTGSTMVGGINALKGRYTKAKILVLSANHSYV